MMTCRGCPRGYSMALLQQHSFSPVVAGMLSAAAGSKSILGGRRDTIHQRLEMLADGLFPEPHLAFADTGAWEPGHSSACLREIGDRFWRDSGSIEALRLAGSFYTPTAYIDRILDLAQGDAAGAAATTPDWTVCDPAMGCGYFLLRLVARRMGAKPDGTREWAARCLYGVDRDPAAVFVARALLWIALSDAEREFIPDAAHLRCGDSLLGPGFSQEGRESGESGGLAWAESFPEVAASGGFDAIVGNPPYEVLTNFGRRPERRVLADALRRSGWYRESIHGQINLYRCFIERSLDLLRTGGVLSFIVPLSLARDSAAEPLRRRLIMREAAAEWLLFSERDEVFPGVTQSACVFRAVRGAGATEHVRVVAGGSEQRYGVDELVEYGGGALAIPDLAPDGTELWKWLWRHCRGRLDDLAVIRVGDVDQTFYRDCMTELDTGVVLARGAHLAAFRLDTLPVPGPARFLDLQRFLAKKGDVAAACRDRAGMLRVVQMGIRNMQSRPRLLAALAPPGVYAGNSLNVYYPHAGVSPRYLAGLLNSSILDWMFRAGSGNNNINIHEMRRLPVPVSPGKRKVRTVESAYDSCVEAAGGGGDMALARQRLDRAVAGCYGITGELLSIAVSNGL